MDIKFFVFQSLISFNFQLIFIKNRIFTCIKEKYSDFSLDKLFNCDKSFDLMLLILQLVFDFVTRIHVKDFFLFFLILDY